MTITEQVVTLNGVLGDELAVEAAAKFESLLAAALCTIEDELRREFGDVAIDRS